MGLGPLFHILFGLGFGFLGVKGFWVQGLGWALPPPQQQSVLGVVLRAIYITIL